MNLILFQRDEIGDPLPLGDPRANHVINTLRMAVGDQFDAGVAGGPIGKGTITGRTAEALELQFEWTSAPVPPDPIHLVVGLPRPQSSRRILREAAALGVKGITFVSAERTDPNYAKSQLWSSDEWSRLLIEGAQQAFDTHIPEVIRDVSLAEAAASAASDLRIAFDNYESVTSLAPFLQSYARSAAAGPRTPVTLAFGPERGWAVADRDTLRSAGFTLASLGRRVLRVETAIVAAVAILRAELRWD